jgi:hypothetical protein
MVQRYTPVGATQTKIDTVVAPLGIGRHERAFRSGTIFGMDRVQPAIALAAAGRLSCESYQLAFR